MKTMLLVGLGALWVLPATALERPDTTFAIFQFPADKIPRIDGDKADWSLVPDHYAIGIDQLKDTVHDSPIDRADLDVTMRVGWVKGLNRLYFLYEAYDDYWDFSHRDLHNDILEIVVDGDLSGDPRPLVSDEILWTNHPRLKQQVAPQGIRLTTFLRSRARR